MALVIVGGYALPTPSEYTANTATVVDAARNVAGYTVGTVIRNDVAKVTLKWNALKPADWAAILKKFDPKYGGAFYQTVQFLNQTSNAMETRRMYVSDRNAGMHILYTENDNVDAALIGTPKYYLGASLSLIEC